MNTFLNGNNNEPGQDANKQQHKASEKVCQIERVIVTVEQVVLHCTRADRHVSTSHQLLRGIVMLVSVIDTLDVATQTYDGSI